VPNHPQQSIRLIIDAGSTTDVSIGGARRPSWRIPHDSLARFVDERRSR
jgi:hypothetical protein